MLLIMKKLFFLTFCLISLSGQAQEPELQAITKTVHLYFEGMLERDRSKLEEAFHPEAKLIGYRGETFTVTPFETWASGTAKGEPRDPSKYQNFIKAIRMEGYTALVETELFWPGVYYYDFLTLLKIEGKWKIVHKSWYEEKR
jgi:hypothetical protein